MAEAEQSRRGLLREALRRPGLSTTVIGLAANSFLCVLKLGVGISVSSLALVSDGVNSLTDAISSTAVLIAVSVSQKDADEGHPFGHHRAEPLAAVILAIFAGIAGFEILKAAVERLFTQEVPRIENIWPFLALAISMLVKSLMSFFFYRMGRRLNSPAILAGAADSKIDVMISFAAIIGVTGTWMGYWILDPLVALVISFFIFKTGYEIGRENIDYLMGKSPSPEVLQEISTMVNGIAGVSRIERLRAHYVGTYIHVDLEITANGRMSDIDVHDLEEMVSGRVEEGIPWVDKAFVHVNPAPLPGLKTAAPPAE